MNDKEYLIMFDSKGNTFINDICKENIELTKKRKVLPLSLNYLSKYIKIKIYVFELMKIFKKI